MRRPTPYSHRGSEDEPEVYKCPQISREKLAAVSRFPSPSKESPPLRPFNSQDLYEKLPGHEKYRGEKSIDGFLDYVSNLPRPTRQELARMDEHAGGAGTMSNAYLSPARFPSSSYSHSHSRSHAHSTHDHHQPRQIRLIKCGNSNDSYYREKGDRNREGRHGREAIRRHESRRGGQEATRDQDRAELRDSLKTDRKPLPEAEVIAWVQQWKWDFGCYPAETDIERYRRGS
jgi:hypothetical protein